MNIFKRVLASQIIFPFVSTLLFCIGFLLTFQLLKITKLAVNKGVPNALLLEIIQSLVFSFLPLAVPLSLFFASYYAMNKMSFQGEYVVFRSLGLSKREIFTPQVITALVVSILMAALLQGMIPFSKRRFKNILNTLTSQGVLASVRPKEFYTEIPDINLYADEVENEGTLLKKVFIHVQKANFEKIIFANTGELKKLGNLGQRGLDLVLKDGNIVQVGTNLENIHFKNYYLPLNEYLRFGAVSQHAMKTTKTLWKIIGDPDALEKYDMSPRDLSKTKLEFYSRFNGPIQCLLFSFLGLCLGIGKTRGKDKNKGALAFYYVGGYYLLYFVGVSMAKSQQIPVALAVFIPTLIFSYFASRLYKSLDWSF